MVDDAFIPLDWTEVSVDEMEKRSESLLTEMRKRRTTRHFSSRDVPKHMIERAILCGGTAPSGAHLQPWTFVAISSQEL
ncbi:MAG: nitroreductase family protein, partial [Candidatus Poseidoniaceae archaeon]